MQYPVTLTKDDNGTYLATFRDVPDAVTFGESIDEALAHARDALLTVFDAYMKDRREIPAPSGKPSRHVVELPALETAKVELYRAMSAGNVGKSELAKRLNWHLPQVDRVLNVRHGSQLDQMEAAFAAVGKRLRLVVADEAGAGVTANARRPGRLSQTRKRVRAGVVAARRRGRVASRQAAHSTARAPVSRKRAAKKR